MIAIINFTLEQNVFYICVYIRNIYWKLLEKEYFNNRIIFSVGTIQKKLKENLKKTKKKFESHFCVSPWHSMILPKYIVNRNHWYYSNTYMYLRRFVFKILNSFSCSMLILCSIISKAYFVWKWEKIRFILRVIYTFTKGIWDRLEVAND